jgi:hypothetical protein
MTHEANHICFGCGEPIGSGQPHIHVGLDEWGQRQGLGSLGFGDNDLLFPFCQPCTEETPRGGWQLEAHEINRPDQAGAP